jgi:2-polyprenyl-3-methyl-5-hydroxy-6-metoxy-1,4-benzoquinol methylase
MTNAHFDQAKAEAFAEKMFGFVNGAFVSLMASLGHRSGLFDTLAGLATSTSDEIAKAAGLNERYVREWLGGMVTGGVIDYDAATKRYSLPAEHAAFLTTAAGPDNLAFFTQYVPLLGSVEDELLECFKNGGGVPYSSFPKFQEVQGEETRAGYDATLVSSTLPLVPGLVDKLNVGIDVADVGCGQGHAINVMAKAFPNSRFTGLDFSGEGVGAGRAEAMAMGLANAGFDVQDAATIDRPERFDFITTFDAIHDQAQPRKVLKNIAAALRPGGTYLMVDIATSSNLEENIDNPWAPLFYGWSTMHCMTVSLALGGEGLGACWGEQHARELLSEAGFKNVDLRQVETDPINYYYICTK